MACYQNGQTYVNTCIPAPGATATDATYVLDLTHYTCGNRKICVNGAYPTTSDLKYRVMGTPQSLGNDVYQCDILVSGTVSYMPYRQGQNCGCGCQENTCPVTENVWCTVSVPWSAAAAPAITAGVVEATPTNVRDCCNLTNAVSLVTSFNLATATGVAAGGNKAK